jgi:hypothetical protein
MKLLIITPYLPWPPDSGGRAALFGTLRAIKVGTEIRVVYSKQDKEAVEHKRILESLFPNLSVILPIDLTARNDTITEANPLRRRRPSTARRFIDSLRTLYHSVSRRRGNTIKEASKQPDSKRLSSITEESPWFPFMPLGGTLIDAIRDNAKWADIIQFEFHDFVSGGCLPVEGKPTVFICHQVHSQYVETWFETKASIKNSWLAKHHIKMSMELESLMLSKFSHVIVFCHEDREYLSSIGVDTNLSVCPFPYPSDHQPIDPSTLHPSEWTNELVFLGSGGHGPNLDGLSWFYSDIYPTILAGLRQSEKPPKVIVVGSWDESQKAPFLEFGATFLGFVDDVSAALRGRVSISPIRIGSGIRTKLLSAAIGASPIVTTRLGCQGLGFQNNVHCLIGDAPEVFALEVIRLLNADTDLRTSLCLNAFTHVTEAFSMDTVRTTRTAVYESLLS